MLDRLAQRGPDERSVFEQDGVQLGHRRLSIIDVVGGAQPVFNEDRTIGCILNGEIYNYRELRAGLLRDGHRFYSKSDTEVLVHLYEQHGDEFVALLEGMYAFALVDFARRRVLIARDRLGEKPLFFYETSDRLTCASEVKSLLALPGMPCRLDPVALARYLRHGWIGGQNSIVAGVRKLRAAHMLIFENDRLSERRYWEPLWDPLSTASPGELALQLREQLGRAMRNKLVADVPVGVLLSGGLDSSAVVALAAAQTTEPLRTFSVGFGSSINELPFAREVAERYGTRHTELIVQPDVRGALDAVTDYFDEPFADSSSIPTYLVCKEARRHVTVMLSGDGGDELLAGYGSYLALRGYSDARWLRGLWRLAKGTTGRKFGTSLLDFVYPLPWTTHALEQWDETRATFSTAQVIALLGRERAARWPALQRVPRGLRSDPLATAFSYDLNEYLPDDLLKKVDMASMASSLECRAPLLDHRLVEFCMRIPPIEKVRGGNTKTLMRAALADDLPNSILRREKQGFGAPLADWLEGPLSAFARDHLLGSTTRLNSILDSAAVERTVRGSLDSLRRDWRAPMRVWILLILELWLQKYGARFDLS